MKWNADSQCAREVCRASLKGKHGRHTDTDLMYCLSCTRLINHYNPGLVLITEDDQSEDN